MRLVRLGVRDVRNLAPCVLDTDARFVVFHGPNAQGKTNALEAVWTLATLRPLRGHRLGDVVRWEAEDAEIRGRVEGVRGTRDLQLAFGGPRRRLTMDGVDERDLGHWFDAVRAIAFQPSDGAIVTEGPAARRRWLDRAAFTASPQHLVRVRDHRRALDQKAACLRASRPDRALLDVLDEQLARLGAELAEARAAMLDALRPHVRHLHDAIAGGTAEVTLHHRTVAAGAQRSERADALREALLGARADELRRRRCLVGPQTDDVDLRLDGQPARHFGSRGQVRSLVLSLKLAELVAARARGQRPLFLLDDLSSELDRARTARLAEELVAREAQVFVTTTDPAHLGAVAGSDVRLVAVRDGILEGSEPVAPDPPTD